MRLKEDEEAEKADPSIEKQLVTSKVFRLPNISANLPATIVPPIAPTVDAVAAIPFLQLPNHLIRKVQHTAIGDDTHNQTTNL